MAASAFSYRVQGTRGSGAGRTLRTTRSFAPGEVIAVFSKPLLALPPSAENKSICSHCLSRLSEPRLCTGCNSIGYCGPKCQKANWTLVHKLECKAMQRMADGGKGDRVLPSSVRAMLQLMLRSEMDEGVKQALMALEGNEDEFRKHRKVWADITLQSQAALFYGGFQGGKNVAERMSVAQGLSCKISTNSFDRFDADTGACGTFMHAELAMVNHSCIPNAVVSFVARKAYLTAATRIEEDDEITISYIDYTEPKTARQSKLEGYHFTCQCLRCREDFDVYEIYSRMSPAPENHLGLNDDRSRAQSLTRAANEVTRQMGSDLDHPIKESQEWKDLIDLGPEERLQKLKRAWQSCQPLVQAEKWAISPVPILLDSVASYMSQYVNQAHALAVYCFIALQCTAFEHPEPYNEKRLRSIIVIAQHIADIAAPAVMKQLSQRTHPRVMQVLYEANPATVVEGLALLVHRSCPGEHHPDRSKALKAAQAMLTDIYQLPGHPKKLQALSNTEALTRNEYFQSQVLKPVQDLASLAVELIVSALSQ